MGHEFNTTFVPMEGDAQYRRSQKAARQYHEEQRRDIEFAAMRNLVPNKLIVRPGETICFNSDHVDARLCGVAGNYIQPPQPSKTILLCPIN